MLLLGMKNSRSSFAEGAASVPLSRNVLDRPIVVHRVNFNPLVLGQSSERHGIYRVIEMTLGDGGAAPKSSNVPRVRASDGSPIMYRE